MVYGVNEFHLNVLHLFCNGVSLHHYKIFKVLIMKKIATSTVLSLSLIMGSTAFASQAQKTIQIGIIVPIALPAMNQIVNGFKKTVSKESKVPVKFLVKNAQGDANIQRSIVQEFKRDHVNIVAPIGTNAAQMTIAMVRNKPIIGIAAEHLKKEASLSNNINVTGDLDQISIKKQIQFMHQAMPKLKKITLIYSADDRIFNQANKVQKYASRYHIKVQKLMIQQLSDLYTVSRHIATDTQALFILKDELIVSGINTLIQQAEAKHIPVIASDDGSVNKGAAFALGVSETQIGVDAGKIAVKIINGEKAGKMPVHIMTHYYVFMNKSGAKKQGFNPKSITIAAKQLGYPVQLLG